MWFKIYFYVVSAIFVVATIATFLNSDPLGLALHGVDSVLVILALVGLFGYLYKKEFLTKRFWRMFTYVFIGWQVFYLIFSVFQQPKSTPNSLFLLIVLLTAVIDALVYVPLIIGLFRYSRDNKNQKGESRESGFDRDFQDITDEVLKGEIPENQLFK